MPPTALEYRRAVRRFLEYNDKSQTGKDLEDVNHFTAWDEPNNYPYQPTSDPAVAAKFFKILSSLCGSSAGEFDCAVAAGDFLDSRMDHPGRSPYLQGYKAALRKRKGAWVKRWAWHAYQDAEDAVRLHWGDESSWWRRFKAFATQTSFGKVNGSEIWLTEQGVLRRRNPNRITGEPRWEFRKPAEARRAMAALIDKGEDSLIEADDRITMFLYYHLQGDRFPNWDSGLLDPDGNRRPIYDMYKEKINP